ncbi:Calponin homology domain [Trypanosoma melophagium]|uniref:Calponin homology domain n=1 Tax=Trypanosoma melophagium TaxID=715481 RepID=UPI00351A4E0C|nr:Calponin homology domain [Trypanosoma melophagium]
MEGSHRGLLSSKRQKFTTLPALTPINRSGAADHAWNQGADEEAAVDTECKIERHRYAKLLLQYTQRYQQFTGVELFVETMLQDLALQNGVSPLIRAAAASWAMKLFCNSTNSRIMEVLVDALFPVIYRDYDEQKLDYAPAAIQSFVNDRNLIRDNPFFSHSTYVQELDASNLKNEALSKRLHRSLTTNTIYKKFTVRILQYINRERKQKAFLAWRNFTKRRRLENMLYRNVMLRHNKTVRDSCLQAAFFRWKTAVETSRTEYFTERLHQAAFQLEGAKNQFQMQCFRADKWQLGYEQGQEDLRLVIEERDALRRKVEELSETIVLKEKEHHERMAARVHEVLLLVRRQRDTLKKVIDSRFRAEDLIADWFDEAIAESNKEATNAMNGGNDISIGNSSSSSGIHTQGHIFLLKWCNYILAQDRTKKPLEVSNFASDFANGEAYYLVLQHVFTTSQIKPPKAVNSSTSERLRWVCKFLETTTLATILHPDDFYHEREDKIATSVAEIFSHHVSEKRMTFANEACSLITQAVLKQETRISDADSGDIPHDEETLKQKVEEWNGEIEQWERELQNGILYERNLQHCNVAVTQEAACIVRERSKGNPFYVITSKSSLIFIKLNVKSMEDLRARFKFPNINAWKTFLRVGLRSVLWKYVHLVTCIFYHFAGVDARQMSEVQFWRFVEEAQLLILPLTPLMVAQIFDIVASPQLAAMLRASAKDEKNATLVEAAQEEIDIRAVKPAQFTEILVRMAVARFSGGLLEVTENFLDMLRFPSLAGSPSATLSFYEPEPQNVVAYFQSDLARVFFFYMKQQLGGTFPGRSRKFQGCGRFMAHLYHTTYLKMFADCDYLILDSELEQGHGHGGYQRKVHFIAADEVLKMLELLQKRTPSISQGEMCFSLFLESFGVACTYWWPDPMVPLSRKLAAFLGAMVEKLRVVHGRSTLVLAAPPFVELEGGEHVDLSR